MALDLKGKTPIQLRAIVAGFGIPGADRMTGDEAIAAIQEYVFQYPQSKGENVQSRFEVYKGEDDLWYWRHVADNGQQLSRSSEGYDSKWNAERARDRAVELVAEEWAHQDREKRRSAAAGGADG